MREMGKTGPQKFSEEFRREAIRLVSGDANNSTFSPSAMNRPLASSLITFSSIDSWNFQSRLSSVF